MIKPTPSESCEVLVLGAGISGLLIANQLVAKHEVVVLEKRAQVGMEKYWMTDQESLEQHPDLSIAVDRRYKTIDFISATYQKFRLDGDFILWDTQRLLELLLSRFIQQGGKIQYGQQVYSFESSERGAYVYSNGTAYATEVIVDCMGHRSPIAYSSGAMKIDGYYLLYGSTFEATSEIDPIGLHNLVMSKQPLYVEAFPCGQQKIHLVLIGTDTIPRPIRSLREYFSFVINKSPYAGIIDSDQVADREFLGGIIPVGRPRARTLNRVLFFGEAGQYNPAASATALTKIMHTVTETGVSLSNCLDAKTLSAAVLSRAIPQPMTLLNRKMQSGLFRAILGWTSKDFDKVIGGLEEGDHQELVTNLLFGSQPSNFGATVQTLTRLVKQNEWTLLGGLLRGLAGA